MPTGLTFIIQSHYSCILILNQNGFRGSPIIHCVYGLAVRNLVNTKQKHLFVGSIVWSIIHNPTRASSYVLVLWIQSDSKTLTRFKVISQRKKRLQIEQKFPINIVLVVKYKLVSCFKIIGHYNVADVTVLFNVVTTFLISKQKFSDDFS